MNRLKLKQKTVGPMQLNNLLLLQGSSKDRRREMRSTGDITHFSFLSFFFCCSPTYVVKEFFHITFIDPKNRLLRGKMTMATYFFDWLIL